MSRNRVFKIHLTFIFCAIICIEEKQARDVPPGSYLHLLRREWLPAAKNFCAIIYTGGKKMMKTKKCAIYITGGIQNEKMYKTV